MSFINDLGMAQRLGAAGIIVLLLALVLVKQRQKGAPKAKKSDAAAVAKPGRRAKGKSAKAKPAKAKKSGRLGRRGKNAEADEPELPTPAVGRMVPRLPSSGDPSGGDAFASALGPVGDELEPLAVDGMPAGPMISEPGWPTPGNENWNAAEAPASEMPADATQPIEAVADAGTAEAGWATEEEMEGFDPATGWSEPAVEAAAPAEAESTDWQTDDAPDWTADDASWETVAETTAPADEPAWTTGEADDTASEWTPVAEEDAAEDAMLQWDPVDEAAPVADAALEVAPAVAAETSFSDWSDSAEQAEPAAEPQEAFTWTTGADNDASELEPAPMDVATLTDEVEAPVFAAAEVAPEAPFADVAAPSLETPMVTADAEIASMPTYAVAQADEVGATAPATSPEPYLVAEPAVVAPTPVVVPDFGAEPAPVVSPEFNAGPVAVAPIVTEPVMAAPVAAEPLSVEPAPIEPAMAAPMAAEPVYVEPAPVAPAMVEPVMAAPLAAEPVYVEPAPVAPAMVEPVMAAPIAAEPVLVEPVAEPAGVAMTFDLDEPRASQVMSAPVVNPLDRWAGLAPSPDAVKPAINPVDAWSRMTPGPAAARVGSLVEATAQVTAPMPVALSVAAPPEAEIAPVEQPATNGGSAWWDMPAGTEHNPRRGRFALGGYALKSGHQVVSGVTFREGIVPPPSDWVVGPVAGTVPPGTLVLEVDGCLNCRAEDLAVLMEPGFAPTTDGFSLRLAALEQGPFAASGNYVIY